jgi:myo-inositol-1-phosphate synthase
MWMLQRRAEEKEHDIAPSGWFKKLSNKKTVDDLSLIIAKGFQGRTNGLPISGSARSA